MVAQADGLADAGEAPAVLGQSGHRGGAGDRSGGEHQDVVVEFHRRGRFARAYRVGPGPAGGVLDPGDPGGEHLALGEFATERDDHVPGVDGAGRDLGEQGVVGEVGLRLYQGEVGLAAAQPLAQAALEVQGGRHARAPAADDQDPDGAPPVDGLRGPPSTGHAPITPTNKGPSEPSCPPSVLWRTGPMGPEGDRSTAGVSF